MKNLLVICLVLSISFHICSSEAVDNKQPKDKEIKENANAALPNARDPSHRKKIVEEANQGKAEVPKAQKDPSYKLALDEACKLDVHELCQHVKRQNNFDVLTCLQNAAAQETNKLSQECHQRLWTYKEQLSKDTRFDDAAKKMCGSTLSQKEFSDCGGDKELQPGGELINCLIGRQDDIEDSKCHQFVVKMASVVFSDYRLIKGFYDQCKNDVEKHKCGHISKETEDDQHSQHDVIECLEENIQEVDNNCKLQILRVAELSSDDYHMDRALFYACQYTRERLCKNVQSGGGQVYKCLLAHRDDNAMAPECKEKLLVREKLSVEDVKVNHGLWGSCKADYEKHKCKKGDTEHGKAAHLLLCLSEAASKGSVIEPGCVAEMQEFSMRLFEEYKLSPELITACEHELQNECKEHLKEENGALNCLMRLGSESKLKNQCYLAVNEILKETNAGNDYKIDRPLYLACEPVVQSVCKGKPNAMILGCLMDNLHSKEMSPSCQDQLYHLQYFLARDFRLDRELFHNCHKDANRLCNAPVFQEENPSMPHGIILSCLYRSSLPDVAKEHKTSVECGIHIRRVMEQRAESVSLVPSIEENCKKDLGKSCLEKQGPGEEIACLQEIYDDLDKTCQQAIANFTEMEAEDPKLDRALIDTCAPMVVKFCQVVIDSQDSDGVLPCLIAHKNEQTMDPRCKASIEHWQILEMKSFKFSASLKKACSNDVSKHCKEVKSKLEAVQCLSDLIHKEEMGQGALVSAKCKAELKQELIRQTENIKFNPALYEHCKEDMKKYCLEREYGDGQMEECLRGKSHLLTKSCREALHVEEVEESKDSELDYNLMKYCKHEIQIFCNDETSETFLLCLEKNIRQPGFTKKCKKIVKERRVEAAKDTSLDPELQETCGSDIGQFCSRHDMQNIHEDLTCLKNHMKEISDDCRLVVKARQIDQAKDVNLNVPLENSCHQQIFELCSKVESGTGKVIECLKENYKKIKGKECKEKVRMMVEEMQRDIRLDVPLHDACSREIARFCDEEAEEEVLQCLMDVYSTKKKKLKNKCRTFLTKRIQLWKDVGSTVKFESLLDLAAAIDKSPHRSYLYTVTLCILLVIFIGGLFFGRITKRIRREIKDR